MTRSWLTLVRTLMNAGMARGHHPGHPAWIAGWLAASAVLVLCTPDQLEKAVRLTRVSVQRPDSDEVRHGAGAGPEGDTTASQPERATAAYSAQNDGAGAAGSPVAALVPVRPPLAPPTQLDTKLASCSCVLLPAAPAFLHPPSHAPPRL